MSVAFRRLTLVGVMLALAAGCSILPSPVPDTTRYYVLTAVHPPNAAQVGTKTLIGLGPITFPDYLARSEIVIRAGGNRLEVSGNNRWAEPLDVMFSRVLSHDLALGLDGAQIATFPWFGTTNHFVYRVEPVIDRFEADDQGVAHLDARWAIFNDGGNQMLYSSSSDLSTPGKPHDDNAMANALSQEVGELAAAIATEINKLQAQRVSALRESDQSARAGSR
jgi:uncharacterized lipoprotein YmbA